MVRHHCRKLIVEPLESRQLLSSTPLTAPVSTAALELIDPPSTISLESSAILSETYQAPYDLASTFSLHGNPSANAVIYLDFNGHTTTGTSWNDDDLTEIVTPAFNADGTSGFSDEEKVMIQYIWQQVCEDFAPFNVDVTTEDPGVDALRYSGSSDEAWGIRVCIGGANSDWYGSSGTGVAVRNSFDYSSDTPCFVFSDSIITLYSTEIVEMDQVGRTISHEVGHTLGLSHDGSDTEEYYSGHGDGATSWSAIMGSSLSNLTQWSIGDYPMASNTEDDLLIITTENRFDYRADDYGDSVALATSLGSGSTLSASGIIERNTDLDFFQFNVSESSPVTILASAFEIGPNLDIEAILYDDSGTPIATSNPGDMLDAYFEMTLSPGTYYVSINGGSQPAGTGDDFGWSDYGSLGQYDLQVLIDPTPLSRLYVDDDASTGGDGYSWNQAFTSLESALQFAQSVNGVGPIYDDVTEIWIAEGTYIPSNPTSVTYERSRTFELVDGVSLLGGFAGTESSAEERVVGTDGLYAHQSILSGDLDGDLTGQKAYRVVLAENLSTTTTLDGLTITGGSADLEGYFPYGGGIYTSAVDDMIIERSVISNNHSVWGAGGIHVSDASTISIIDSVVSGNTSDGSGGGIYVTDVSELTIVGSSIADNTSDSYGGGVYLSTGSVDLVECFVTDNSATGYAGGIYTSNGSIELVDSFVTGNQGRYGGGLLISTNGQLLVSSTTIAKNTAVEYAGGIFLSGTATLYNTIVAHNQAETYADLYGTYQSNSAGNLIRIDYFNSELSSSLNILGSTSSPKSPGFVDLASNDFRLTSGSIAIGAGDATLLPNDTFDLDEDGNTAEPLSLDADGGARVVGAQLDIGAWELPPTVELAAVIDLDEGNAGSSIAQVAVTLSEPASADIAVTYFTANNSAIAGEDYAETLGTLVFLPGQTSKTIDIPIYGDTTIEDDETLTVRLDTVDRANIGNDTATITILDDDANNPPDIAADETTLAVNEGDTATMTGTYGDVDGDMISLSASIGTVVPLAGGRWEWSYLPADGPDDSQMVIISADDGDGHVTDTQFVMTVENVTPKLDIGGDRFAPRDFPTSLAGITFTDPSTTDTHQAWVDWGEGDGWEPITVVEPIGSEPGIFDGSHVYTTDGVFTVQLRVQDSDGAEITDSYNITTITNDVVLKLTSQTESDPLFEGPADLESLISEWEYFTIEIWMNPSGQTFDAASLSVQTNTALFVPLLDEIIPGPLFTTGSGSLTPSINGDLLSFVATTDTPQDGSGGYCLLAQVPIVPSDPTGAMPLPHDLTSPTAAEYAVQLVEGSTTLSSVTAHVFASANDTTLDVLPAIYDLNDNGTVDIADLSLFAASFGHQAAQATDPLVILSDFDADGTVAVGDLAYFAANFGKTQGDTLLFPESAISAILPQQEPVSLSMAMTPVEELQPTQAEEVFINEVPEITPTITPITLAPLTTNGKDQLPSESISITPSSSDLYFTESEKATAETKLDIEPIIDVLVEELVEYLI